MPHGDFGSSGWLFLDGIKATPGLSPWAYTVPDAGGGTPPAKSPANRAGLCLLRTRLLYREAYFAGAAFTANASNGL